MDEGTEVALSTTSATTTENKKKKNMREDEEAGKKKTKKERRKEINKEDEEEERYTDKVFLHNAHQTVEDASIGIHTNVASGVENNTQVLHVNHHRLPCHVFEVEAGVVIWQGQRSRSGDVSDRNVAVVIYADVKSAFWSPHLDCADADSHASVAWSSKQVNVEVAISILKLQRQYSHFLFCFPEKTSHIPKLFVCA